MLWVALTVKDACWLYGEADTEWGVQGHLEEHFMGIVVDLMDLCKLGSSFG